ncbi:MAG: hypothetical protein PWR03_2124 [Tenuifilum sp.]|jgi:hypothetical protein|uniref:DUF4389 domain-containing protein n=1 Tax=Tenuifilum sp. TaxID=2760880 RepID=UPI0024AADA0D|nr:DUF4389 domain-containing protein [Tenuifilum sp.]MDI3527940.1 hypothetical protein [Tenuifilum sp.]
MVIHFLPHGFLLIFVSLWAQILQIIAFWAILFTGKYPKSLFDFQVGLMRWNLRLNARIYNISDGYPAFGINATDEYTSLEVEYPEKVSRGLMLVRFFFGWLYVYIPHFFILAFRGFFVNILVFFAWFVVLFTGKYPQEFHNWVVGQLRWMTRVGLYMSYMTDEYPAFTGDELPNEK